MSNSPLKLISPTRVKTLLECYGADPADWPGDERNAAVSVLNQSGELQHIQQQAKRLDNLLQLSAKTSAVSEPARSELVTKIIDNLPLQSAHSDSHLPNRRWPIAAAAAILMLAIPLYLQLHRSSPAQPFEQVASVDYEQWLWEDITGDTFVTDNEALDFLTLVELEQPNR